MTRTLDGFRQRTLVFCTGTGLPSCSNFSVLVDESAQQIGIFIINHQTLVCTKLAGAGAIKPPPLLKPTPWSGLCLIGVIFCHNESPY
jgi:hypothetical protein